MSVRDGSAFPLRKALPDSHPAHSKNPWPRGAMKNSRLLSLAVAQALLLLACAADRPTVWMDPPERWATADEIATWALSADEARELAAKWMQEDQPSTHLGYDVDGLMRGNAPIWRVQCTSLIAGGWEVEIDPRNGRLCSARTLPGR